MKYTSIRQKLTFSVSLYISILLVTMMTGTYMYFRHTTRQMIFSQQFSMVTAMAKGLDDKIRSAQNAINALSGVVPHEKIHDRAAILTWLNDRKGTQSIFNHGLFLLDENGECVSYNSTVPHLSEATAVQLKLVFTYAKNSGWRHSPFPLQCSSNKHPIILMTSPIFDRNGDLRGILCGAIDLLQKDSLFNDIVETRLGTSGYMYLFAPDRTIIVHRDGSRIGNRDTLPGTNRVFDMAIAGFNGSDENVNSYGGHYITSVKRLGNAEWILAANYPYDEAMQSITRFRNTFVLGTLLMLLAGILMARRLSGAIITPLIDLTGQIRNLPKPVAVWDNYLETSDTCEIGTLAESFNGMLHEIRGHEEQLRVMTATLEEEIAERQKSEEKLQVQIDIYETGQRLLEESNERFRTLYEASFGGISIHENGIILDCNQGLSYMTGYSIEELVGMKIVDLVADENRDDVVQNLLGNKELSREVTGVRQDGGRYHLKLWSKNIPYQGRVVLVTEFRDITQRKVAEEERLLLEQQFHHAQKLESLGVLAGGIAHDFNNILTVITNQCYLIRRESENGARDKGRIGEIEDAAHRAAELCRQMLTYAGKNQLNMTSIDLNREIDEIVKMLKSAIESSIEISLDLDGGMPAITGDKAQIQQIVMNLAINAADAIGEGNGTIAISSRHVDIRAVDRICDHLGAVIPPGAYCCIEVTDSGCGMSAATQKRIFEPFFSTKSTGRGLGMSAILGIIKSHNGYMQLSSSPGCGTTFSIFFPVSGRCETCPDDTPAVAELQLAGGVILVVEDDDVVRGVALAILDVLGYTTLSAVNGMEAVEIYRARVDEIDLVMLDLIMPVMNGTAAYQELRGISPTVPIIMCSGYSEEKVEDGIRADVHTRFIQKPYRPAQLSRMLLEMMRKDRPDA